MANAQRQLGISHYRKVGNCKQALKTIDLTFFIHAVHQYKYTLNIACNFSKNQWENTVKGKDSNTSEPWRHI